ncbi:hypothetical protein K3495_g10304 [Podosphaera aphanis]|nr:hypothetical protein K3495_g10304 [Podosphaera aphanis]
MNRNNVWTLVPRPDTNGKLMTGKWTLEENSDGSFKARWCARGLSEPLADDPYADVLPPTTMRMLLAYASTIYFHIRHVDITAAFFHAEIGRPIYTEQPHGREQPGNLVSKLQKAIYGLRTAPKRLQLKLRYVLSQMGSHPPKADSNVFCHADTTISTYVDDFIIISISRSNVDKAIKSLAKAFQLKDLGNMTKFVDIKIEKSLILYVSINEIKSMLFAEI